MDLTLGKGKVISLSFRMLRLALGPVQPPIQWVPGDLFSCVKANGA
jgi:hypothetical protein